MPINKEMERKGEGGEEGFQSKKTVEPL